MTTILGFTFPQLLVAHGLYLISVCHHKHLSSINAKKEPQRAPFTCIGYNILNSTRNVKYSSLSHRKFGISPAPAAHDLNTPYRSHSCRCSMICRLGCQGHRKTAGAYAPAAIHHLFSSSSEWFPAPVPAGRGRKCS